MKTKLLFVCTANVDRSPAAENLFKDSMQYEAKSAGTRTDALQPVTQELINWADKIFVMSEIEDGHLTYLRKNFELTGKEVFDLNIPDIFDREDPQLKQMLESKLSKYIEI